MRSIAAECKKISLKSPAHMGIFENQGFRPSAGKHHNVDVGVKTALDAKANKKFNFSRAQTVIAIAKHILFTRLTRLRVGHLKVEESGKTYTFGQADRDSPIVAKIKIHDPAAYSKILFGGATGAGEAYMLNAWSSPELVEVIRLFVANKRYLSNMDSAWSWLKKNLHSLGGCLRINTLAGSRKNIAAHYDLSNDFFKIFLDRSLMYSSAMFPEADVSLDAASFIKLDHICNRLNLSTDDHLLEIGSGWGGMAIHAAKHYGCRVTTTTISEQQYELARERVAGEGLADRVTVLMQDYRELAGSYDKIVSIEMVEAVGHRYYGEFFSCCSRLLRPRGLMLMQAITTQDQRFEREKNKSDFIRKYIFPGGCLPSNEVIMKNIAGYTDMHLVGLEDITSDYAKTLAEWRHRFFAKIDEVKSLGFDDIFIRMWDFYLCYCEGGFRERVINTAQFLFAKPLCRDLPVISALARKSTTSRIGS